MAMYENLGFCPESSFGFYKQDHSQRKSFARMNRVLDILGNRISYMVYDTFSFNFNGAYVVDMFLGGDCSLGVKVATSLLVHIPVCENSSKGKKILIRDLINPYQTHLPLKRPDNLKEGNWSIIGNNSIPNYNFFQDNRYLVLVYEKNGVVHLEIFKK